MSGIQIDTRQFKEAIRFVHQNTRKDLAEILNQRAFNVAARAIDDMKPAPGSEQGTRGRIKAYMDTPLGAPKLRVIQSGKRRGQLTRKGRKQDRLTRKNLIVQARRAKAGLTGLYGMAMRMEAGELSRRAQVGVGFLKSPFLPIIKGLHALVKYKRVRTAWGRISVWPGSKGYGKITPAKAGFNVFVEMLMRWQVPGAPTKVQRMVLPHLQAAFDAEAREMVRHTTEKLQQTANKVNAKWRRSTFP